MSQGAVKITKASRPDTLPISREKESDFTRKKGASSSQARARWGLMAARPANCEVCGSPIVQKSTGRPRKYCLPCGVEVMRRQKAEWELRHPRIDINNSKGVNMPDEVAILRATGHEEAAKILEAMRAGEVAAQPPAAAAAAPDAATTAAAEEQSGPTLAELEALGTEALSKVDPEILNAALVREG